METQIRIALAHARDFQTREAQRVAEDRRFAHPGLSIRRAVGRRVIAVGQRIAAEPTYELARSR